MTIINEIRENLANNGEAGIVAEDEVLNSIFNMTNAEFNNIRNSENETETEEFELFMRAFRRTMSLRRVERLANLHEGAVAENRNSTEVENAERFFGAFDAFENITRNISREEVEERFRVFRAELTAR